MEITDSRIGAPVRKIEIPIMWKHIGDISHGVDMCKLRKEFGRMFHRHGAEENEFQSTVQNRASCETIWRM